MWVDAPSVQTSHRRTATCAKSVRAQLEAGPGVPEDGQIRVQQRGVKHERAGVLAALIGGVVERAAVTTPGPASRPTAWVVGTARSPGLDRAMILGHELSTVCGPKPDRPDIGARPSGSLSQTPLRSREAGLG